MLQNHLISSWPTTSLQLSKHSVTLVSSSSDVFIARLSSMRFR